MIKVIFSWCIRSAFKNILATEIHGNEAAEFWTFSCYFGIPETQPLLFQLSLDLFLGGILPSASLWMKGGIILVSAWKKTWLHCACDNCHFLSSSQLESHKIFEVRKHLWRLSNATHCSNQGQPEQAAHNCRLPSHSLNISKDGDFTTSLSNLFHCLITLRDKVFSCV